MTNFKVMQGHVPLSWDLNFIDSLGWKKFNYNTDLHNARWQGDAEQYSKVNADVKFSVVYDIFENYPTEFEFINKHFQWLNNKHLVLFKFSPGESSGLHTDRYAYYSNKYDIQNDHDIFRVIVFLEDWKSGHYLEVNGKGFTNWSAGDWVGWDLPTPHLAANLGTEERYTLQITGTLF